MGYLLQSLYCTVEPSFSISLIFGCAGLSLAGGQASHCGGLSCGAQASLAVGHELSCSMAGGIFLDKGSNPCPLRWQVDS